MITDTNRQANGTFANGHTVNKSPYQRYGDRAQVIQECFTAEEIMEIVADKTRLYKYSPRDAQIFMQIAKSLQFPDNLTNADARAERETLLDRMEGKSTNVITGDVNVNSTLVQIQLSPDEVSQLIGGWLDTKLIEHETP